MTKKHRNGWYAYSELGTDKIAKVGPLSYREARNRARLWARGGLSVCLQHVVAGEIVNKHVPSFPQVEREARRSRV